MNKNLRKKKLFLYSWKVNRSKRLPTRTISRLSSKKMIKSINWSQSWKTWEVCAKNYKMIKLILIQKWRRKGNLQPASKNSAKKRNNKLKNNLLPCKICKMKWKNWRTVRKMSQRKRQLLNKSCQEEISSMNKTPI